jgi:hypothetical protein
VIDDGIRCHADLEAGAAGAPTEVDVVAEHRQSRVETLQGLPDIAPDQHAGRADREHVARLVVLPLVELAVLDAGVAAAAERRGDADLEQVAVPGPEPQLRSPDPDLGRDSGLKQQLLEGLGCGGAVVVEQPEPLDHRDVPVVAVRTVRRGDRREADRLDTAGHCRPEPGPGGDADHGLDAWHRGEQFGGLVGGSGVDRDQPVGARVQRPQRLGQARQPGRALVTDHHRGHDVPDPRATHRVVDVIGREIDRVEELPAGRSFLFHAEL